MDLDADPGLEGTLRPCDGASLNSITDAHESRKHCLYSKHFRDFSGDNVAVLSEVCLLHTKPRTTYITCSHAIKDPPFPASAMPRRAIAIAIASLEHASYGSQRESST